LTALVPSTALVTVRVFPDMDVTNIISLSTTILKLGAGKLATEATTILVMELSIALVSVVTALLARYSLI
jgi:hypothetical protein